MDKSTGTFVFVSNGQSEWQIVVSNNAHQAVHFAAEELQRYLQHISGACLPIYHTAQNSHPNTLAIAHSEEAVRQLLRDAPTITKPDGFYLQVSAAGIVLVGQRPRSLLYAAYAFLSHLGCRWLGPGDEVIPSLSTIQIDAFITTEAPTFAHRDFCEDCAHIPWQDAAWRQLQAADDAIYVDWLAKGRLSGFYPFRWTPVDSSADDVLGEMQKRDLEMIGGGHVIPPFLPRELFDEHPEYFRVDASGQRVANGNFCVSNREAMAVVCQAAVAHAHSRPHLGLLNIWGDDVHGGSWCSCPQCQSMTPQDQYITACNAILAGLRQAGITTQVAFIVYYDTLVPELRVKPDPELYLLFAPRLRCYAHGLGDDTCELNAWHRTNLEKWLAYVAPARVAAFEYYGDTILYRSLGIAIPQTIIADMQYYRQLGASRVTEHSISATYSYLSQPLNYFVYAAAAWNPDIELDTLLDDYCRYAYGAAAGMMKHYWTLAEQGTSKLATYGDITDPPIAFGESMRKLIHLTEEALGDLEQAGPFLSQALALELDEAARQRVLRDQAIWEFTRDQAAGLIENLHGNYYQAGADSGHLWNVAARQPDGTYIGWDDNSNQTVYRPKPRAPRGYVEAIRHLQAASALYQRGQEKLIASLPLLRNSTWITSKGGLFRQQDALLRRLQAQIDMAQARQSEYGG